MEAKHGLTIILTLISIFTLASASSASSSAQFIQDSCNKTTYPSLCLKALRPYASAAATSPSPYELCDAALTAAIHAATNCSSAASKAYNASRKSLEKAEAGVVKDCISDLKDAVYELKETVGAMAHLGNGAGGEDEAEKEFQWSNAKTYASAAITDAETCVDGFQERKVSSNGGVRKKMKGCVAQVEMMISNALSLINHLYS